jgi:hypothetical protein
MNGVHALRALVWLLMTVTVSLPFRAEEIAEFEPDRALVATGSEPDDRYPGAVSAAAMLAEGDATAGPVIVIDEEGHRKGSGLAEALALDGRDVTLVGDRIAPASQLASSLAETTTLRRLREAGVRLVPGARVVAVVDGGVVVQVADGVEELAASVVVHAGRHRPVDGLVGALRVRGIATRAVGDARVPRLVEDAIRSGWEAAKEL